MRRSVALLVSVSSFAILGGCPSTPGGSPPAAPTGLFTQPQGISPVQRVVVQGRAGPGETVEVFVDGNCQFNVAGTGSADQFASPGIEIRVPANANTMIAARARKGDLVSGCSAPVPFIHDSVAPEPPVLTKAELVPATWPPRAKLTGTAERAARVSVFVEPECKGTPVVVVADGTGAFSAELTIPANDESYPSASAQDAAGNTSGCSGFAVVRHDNTPPAAPVLFGTIPDSPSKHSAIKVNGAAESRSRVRLFQDAQCSVVLGNPEPLVVPDDGAFQLLVTVPLNTTTQIHANATDAADNVSPCSSPLAYTHDGTPPSEPAFGYSSPSSPSRTTTTFWVTISGEPGTKLEVFGLLGCSGTAVLNQTMPQAGSVQVPLPVPANGSTTFTARSTDGSGNVSTCTPGFTLAHDDLAPGAPTLTGTLPASPSTTQSTPTVQGSGEAGSTVQLFRTGGCGSAPYTSVVVPASGLWAAQVPAFANNTTTFSARATDDAGNLSACSNDLVYVHDNQAPVAPKLVATLPPSPSKVSTTPQVLGTGEAGTTAQLFTDAWCTGTPAVTGAVTSSGFALAVTVPASTTTYLSANLRDVVGNVSPCSTSLTYQHSPTGGWTELLTLGTGNPAQAPAVALTPSGAVALWASAGSGNPVVTSDYSAGSWSAPAELISAATDLADPIRVASNAAGDVAAVWSQLGAATVPREAWVAQRPGGGSWSAPQKLDASEGHEPDVAVDASGTAMAIWWALDGPYQDHLLRSSLYTPGSGWAAPVAVGTNYYPSYTPRVIFLSNGEAVAVFTEATSSTSTSGDRLSSIRWFGGLWQQQGTRSTYAIRRGEYSLQAGGSGGAMVAWVQRQSTYSSYYRPYSARFAAGYFASARYLTSSSTDAKRVALAMGAANEALGVWTDASRAVQAARNTTSSIYWSYAYMLGAVPSAPSDVPIEVVSAPDGNGMAVWIGAHPQDAAAPALWLSRFDAASLNWGAPQLLDGPLGPGDRFDVAMDGARTVVVWQKTAPSGTSVLARALE